MTNAARFDLESHPSRPRLGNVSLHQFKWPACSRDLNNTHLLGHGFSIASLVKKHKSCAARFRGESARTAHETRFQKQWHFDELIAFSSTSRSSQSFAISRVLFPRPLKKARSSRAKQQWA